MENPHFNINRRRFMKSASALTLLSTFGTYGMDLIYRDKPWKVALIGTGWYGKMDLWRLIQVAPVEVKALCDVDRHMLEEAAAQLALRQPSAKPPRLFMDYRKMLAETELDIVLIATPDHWHALTAIDAIKSGCHVYLQKPISVDVLEGEAILATARRYGKTVQVGTQRRNTPHLHGAKEKVVDAGLLGKIGHVELCCYFHMRANGNPPVQEVPEFFDYEMWTGPAPLRPYDGLPHIRWWRTFMEYGNGIMGDMCVHMLDTVRWLLKLDWPNRISSHGGIYVQTDGKSNIADTQTAVFEFDGFNCTWQHRSWGTPADPEYPWSFKIYGEKGTLAGSTMQWDFYPQGDGPRLHEDVLYEREKFPEDVNEASIELHAVPATRRHMLDFLASIEGGTLPFSDIKQGHISSASCILANLAMKVGRPLRYDPGSHTLIGDPEAQALLKRAYREGWQHPYETL